MKNIITVIITTIILIAILHTFYKFISNRDTALMESGKNYSECIKAKYGQNAIISNYAGKETCIN